MTASQSSLNYGHDGNPIYQASRCLDGPNTHCATNAVSSNAKADINQIQPWWEVDLGAEATVFKVKLLQCLMTEASRDRIQVPDYVSNSDLNPAEQNQYILDRK